MNVIRLYVVREEEKEETKKESRDKQGKEATEDIIQQEEHVTLTTLFVDSKYEETLSQYELALQVALNMSLSVEVRLICHANRAACYQKLTLEPDFLLTSKYIPGKYDSTVKECTQALELNPAYIKALARRGEAHDKLEHFEEAIADMKRILEIDPSNDQARKGICRLEPLAAEKREKMKEEMMDKFILQHGGRALLVDEMGLSHSGKLCRQFITRTFSYLLSALSVAIAVASRIQDSWPVLILAPSSLHLKWASMIQQWLNLPSLVCLVVYESYYLKNLRKRGLLQLFRLQSGTPALFRPIELFKQMEALYPDAYKNVH
ncbi:hypothetical protein AHAS_Ahas11G0270800 [Arachis hypogaea]